MKNHERLMLSLLDSALHGGSGSASSEAVQVADGLLSEKEGLTNALMREAAEFSDDDWTAFFKAVAKQKIGPVIAPLLKDFPGCPQAYCDALLEDAFGTGLLQYRLCVLTGCIMRLFEENNIKAYVLKGSAAAVYYPVPEARASLDVDILIPSDEDRLRAEEVLRENGMTDAPDTSDEYHDVFVNENGTEVELHGHLSETFDHKNIDSVALEIEEKVSGKRFTAMTGVEMETLNDAEFAYSLLIHMLHHYLRKGFGLRLLTDWMCFWERTSDEETRATFIDYAKRSGLLTFTSALSSLCVRYLGMNEESAAFLLKAPIAPEYEDSIMEDILDGGEFGLSGSPRMVNLRGSGIAAYASEFHHRMRRNYPKASKVFLTWPFLYVATLYKFLKNNKKHDRGSTSEILKKAGERGKSADALRIFKV